MIEQIGEQIKNVPGASLAGDVIFKESVTWLVRDKKVRESYSAHGGPTGENRT
jgi:hypothetical protein